MDLFLHRYLKGSPCCGSPHAILGHTTFPAHTCTIVPDSMIVDWDGTHPRLDAFNLNMERARFKVHDVCIKPYSLITFFGAYDWQFRLWFSDWDVKLRLRGCSLPFLHGKLLSAPLSLNYGQLCLSLSHHSYFKAGTKSIRPHRFYVRQFLATTSFPYPLCPIFQFGLLGNFNSLMWQ